MKKEKGSLTIEASVALVVFMFFILAFLTIGRYVRVQNRVKHSLNQTAISMSLRNFQYVQVEGMEKALVGTKASDIAQIVGYFSADLASDITTTLKSPYTTTMSSLSGSSSGSWSSEDLKAEVLRVFAYYYIGGDYSQWKSKSFEQVKAELEENGLEDIEISSGQEGQASLVSGKKLNVQITYRVNAGVSFYSFFGRENGPKFTDSITIVMMK